MSNEIASLLQAIDQLPNDWHRAGSGGSVWIRGIAEHLQSLGPIRHSAETGSGKTTLLFSHLSQSHTVFAVDDGNSISQVKKSPLFDGTRVHYVEGPTQLTLPQHRFADKLDVALIDGPHGYPFPDLEYLYFYPQIARGGLLLVDDIAIPSIRRMAEIIAADDMFDLIDTVDGNLAVFRRTDAPAIDPHSDSWWLQGYNRAHHQRILNGTAHLSSLEAFFRPKLVKIVRVAAQVVPQALRGRMSERMQKRLWN